MPVAASYKGDGCYCGDERGAHRPKGRAGADSATEKERRNRKLPPVTSSSGKAPYRTPKTQKSRGRCNRGAPSQNSAYSFEKLSGFAPATESTPYMHLASARLLEGWEPVTMPLDRVMSVNGEAMDAVRDGDMKKGYDMLILALLAARQGLLQTSSEANTSPDGRADREAWLLAYSVTLSNLGCQLRRNDRAEDALLCLRDACAIERELLGKASCSTMLNLSVVLLGVGAVEEALPIAKDCVSAAQRGDRVLFITALHNLAVVLGQHPLVRERQAALPTMLRALRESQQHNGENHPTTIMLKEKCGMTQPWIARSESLEPDRTTSAPATASPRERERLSLAGTAPTDLSRSSRGSHGVSVGHRVPRDSHSRRLLTEHMSSHKVGSGQLAPLPRPELPDQAPFFAPSLRSNAEATPSSLQLKAKLALQSLDFGSPAVPLSQSLESASGECGAMRFACRNDASSDMSGLSSLSLKHEQPPRITGGHPLQDERFTTPTQDVETDNGIPFLRQPLVSDDMPHTMASTQPDAALGDWSPSNTTSLPQPRALHISALHAAVNPETDARSGPSADPHDPMSRDSNDGAELPFVPEKQVNGPETINTTQHHGQLVEQMIHSNVQPALPLFSSESAAIVDMTTSSSTSVLADPSVHVVSTANAISCIPYVSTPLTADKSSSCPGHTVHLNREGQPSFLRFASIEDVDSMGGPRQLTYSDIRSKLRRDAEAIIQTPKSGNRRSVSAKQQNHTAPVVSWGLTSSGKIKEHSGLTLGRSIFSGDDKKQKREAARELQLKEEAMYRARRQKEAQAQAQQHAFETALEIIVARTRDRAARAIQRVWTMWWSLIGKPRHALQLKKAAERERRLRERLALLDQAKADERLRSKRKSHGVTKYPSAHLVVKCGQLWLLKTQCLRYLAQRHIDSKMRTEAQVARLVTLIQAHWRGVLARRCWAQTRGLGDGFAEGNGVLNTEVQSYAALVIQQLFRRFSARRVRQRLSEGRYLQPAIIIQRWFRECMMDQRRRGVDQFSIDRRCHAAYIIQRNWRGYQGRVRYFMAKLRFTISESRRKELHSIQLIQRVSRAFLSRSSLSVFMAKLLADFRSKETVRAVEEHARPPSSGMEVRHWPDLGIPRNEYEQECLNRYPIIAKMQEADREKYHVPLFLEPTTNRERQAWVEALRLRPFEVETRRANEDLRTEMEARTIQRERAAIKIQREFRRWRWIRHDPRRDGTLLRITRGIYQRREYERLVQLKRAKRMQERAVKLYGDLAEPMRSSLHASRTEMRELLDGMPDSLPPESIRTRAQRKVDEANLQRDELIVSVTYPRDLEALRNSVDGSQQSSLLRAHPYYQPTPSRAFQRALGIDL